MGKKLRASGRNRAILSTCLKLLPPIVAAVCYLLPPPASFIERYYSTGIYPRLQPVLTSLSNLIPIAIADILIVTLIAGLPLWWILRVRRAGKGRRLRAIASAGIDTLSLAGALTLAFLALWAFNYFRLPLTKRLDYDQDRITLAAAWDLALANTKELNAISPEVHATGWPNRAEWTRKLLPSFNQVVRDLGNPRDIVAARPKSTILNFYLAASGIDGFTNPFGDEIILNWQILPPEQPFLMAHEWAHVAGFADESEANFIAFLACVRSTDPAVRYSARLELYSRLSRLKNPGAADEALPPLDPAALQDLRNIARRQTIHLSAAINEAQWRAYDKFLKANRVQAGMQSYDLFIRLLLGARFEADWQPVLGN